MAQFTASRLLALLSLLGVHVYAAVTLESLPAVPAGWSAAAAPAEGTLLTLQVALTQQNIDQLESRLQAVSTPGTATYGQYLDIDEVNALFAPTSENVAAVESWLESYGIQDYTEQSGSITFTANVSTANSLLGTEFTTYTDSTGASKIRTTEYSIPESLVGAVDFVTPTTYFGVSNAVTALKQEKRNLKNLARRSTAALPAACNETLAFEGETFAIFSPSCLRSIYGVDDYTPEVKSGSRVGYGSFLNSSTSYSDFAQFQKLFDIPFQNLTTISVNDGIDFQPPVDDGEANLDSQNIVSFAHPLPITQFITGGSPPYFPDPVEPVGTPNENEPYLQYYEYILSKPNSEIPQVISQSYGDEEQTVPEAYAIRVCNLIGLVGLRGITVLHSSGDEGVGASCTAQNSTVPQFNPIFPATCPYVTSVGGTVNFEPEIAWDGSSGGFSSYFSRPWYQDLAIPNYINKYVSPSTKKYYSSFTNFNGRGFPDVAAHSVDPDYSVVTGGELTPSGGTSAASPITAAVIALLNDARLRAGKPTLGFINPLIYLYASSGFTDITSGQTEGCNGDDTQSGSGVPGSGVIPGAFWNATVGWDPTTGFGVPNFPKLLELFNGGGSTGWNWL